MKQKHWVKSVYPTFYLTSNASIRPKPLPAVPGRCTLSPGVWPCYLFSSATCRWDFTPAAPVLLTQRYCLCLFYLPFDRPHTEHPQCTWTGPLVTIVTMGTDTVGANYEQDGWVNVCVWIGPHTGQSVITHWLGLIAVAVVRRDRTEASTSVTSLSQGCYTEGIN